MIDITKKYRTRDGKSVRILCTDMANTDYPVVGVVKYADGKEEVETFTNEGTHYLRVNESDYDLFEVTPYDDVKIDDPVFYRCNPHSQTWLRGYFAGLNGGRPTVWVNQQTSWITKDRIFVQDIRTWHASKG